MKDSLRPESESRSTLQNPCRPEDDLKALARLSKRDLPTIEDSMRALAERQNALSREGFMTELVRKAKTTPWLPPVAAAAVAAILLLVPVSYTTTTGYDVNLSLDGAQVRPEQVSKISDELGKALHASGMNMKLGDSRVELTAHVPVAQARGVAGVARAFAAELKARHIDAEASVVPITSKVQGNVYAMAMSRVINVNVQTTGRSDADIAADIKNQLQAAGLEVTNVTYETKGNERILKVTNENHDPNTPDNDADADAPEIKLTIDGKEPPAGAHQMKVTVEHQPGDTDESIRLRIVDQLKAQGIDATVVVKDGKIVSIDPIKH